MKINLDSIEKASSPIESFYAGCSKSQSTKRNYTSFLKKMVNEFFEDILKSEGFENRVNELVNRAKDDPKWIMGVMVALMKILRESAELPKGHEKKMSSSAVNNYLNAMKKLLDMNEIPLIWKKIYAMKPELEFDEDTRGYFRKEIQRMLDFASVEDKTIILIASSSGIRLGGFAFRWRDIRPVYLYKKRLLFEDEEVTESVSKEGKIVCALILIYRNSKSSQFALITPEAYDSVLDYKKDWIKQVGREPKSEDPFLKTRGMWVKPLQEAGISKRVSRVLEVSEIRGKMVKGQRRHEIPLMNGFRRYFNKVNKESLSRDSPLAQLILKERMMGHKTGLISLDRNYFKTHVRELIEEYLNSVPNLTISEAERLKTQNRNLRKEKETLEKIKDVKLADMERQIKEVRKILSSEYRKKSSKE